jgi:SNF2 family DNA or RNA helicase
VPKVTHLACSDDNTGIIQSIEQSYAATTDFNPPCPEGLSYYPYQRAGIQFALNRKGTIIADEMGLGKTVQAIGVTNCLTTKQNILVVCPASLRLTWRSMIDTWRTSYTHHYDITSYNLLDRASSGYDVLICDEAHYLANPSAKRTQHVLRIKASMVLLLTGTPITSYPKQLWSLLAILDPDTWGNNKHAFKRFQNRYCAPRLVTKGFGSTRRSFYIYTGLSHGDELNARLRSSVMVRRMKQEVLKELPPKTRRVVTLERRDNTGIIDWQPHPEDSYDDVIRHMKTNRIQFEAWSKTRHDQGLAKVTSAVEYILTILKEVSCAIVFVHHRDVLNAIHLALYKDNVSALCIHGDVPSDDSLEGRKAQVDAFQNGTASVMLGTYGAMGTGWTLTRASTVVCVELPLTPGELSQAEDRAHRIGQKGNVDVHHLVEDGSIDARIIQLLIKKQEMMEKVLR